MGWSFWYYLKPAPLISPVIDQYPSGVCVTCRQGISKEELTIENMIKDIFKEDSGKAFKLLSCENERLRPNAVNVNKDGSQDLGIFQLNSNWHGFNKPVNNKRYLFDPKVNIAIAYRLYVDSGRSFKMWVCGKHLSI